MSLKLIVLSTIIAVVTGTKPYQGYVVPLFDSRIVGGADTTPGQFPWQVSLQWGSIFGYQHFCGGSILNSQWILTAGHCVQAVPAYGKFVVKAGKFNLKKTEGNEQTIKVAKSFVHEKYPGNVAPYDIALLKLEKPLTLNSVIKAVNLPKADSIPTGESILSGWGSISTTNNPIMPEKLQYAELPIIDFDTCKKSIEELTGPSPLAESNVCTGPLTGGHSACSGDSGGPLVANTNGKTEVIGVVSWGIVPCGTVGAPSVYTRTSAYIDWLNKIMNNN